MSMLSLGATRLLLWVRAVCARATRLSTSQVVQSSHDDGWGDLGKEPASDVARPVLSRGQDLSSR